MRIALISDIHGNIDALEAVLESARADHADMLLFLGDYIFDMPFSNQVVHRLMELTNARFVAGNKEGYLKRLDWKDENGILREQSAVLYQTYADLDKDARAFLLSLPESIKFSLPSGKTVYAAHTLRDLRKSGKNRFNSSGRFYMERSAHAFTREEYLRDLQAFYEREMASEAKEIGADAIVYGHNHLQGYGCAGGALLVDAGACGMPCDFDTRAPYTLLDDTPSGLFVTEKRVAYDIERAVDRAKRTVCYEKGRIWSEITHRTLRTGWDNSCAFFSIVRRDFPTVLTNMIDNQTMRAAYHTYRAEYCS